MEQPIEQQSRDATVPNAARHDEQQRSKIATAPEGSMMRTSKCALWMKPNGLELFSNYSHCPDLCRPSNLIEFNAEFNILVSPIGTFQKAARTRLHPSGSLGTAQRFSTKQVIQHLFQTSNYLYRPLYSCDHINLICVLVDLASLPNEMGKQTIRGLNGCEDGDQCG